MRLENQEEEFECQLCPCFWTFSASRLIKIITSRFCPIAPVARHWPNEAATTYPWTIVAIALQTRQHSGENFGNWKNWTTQTLGGLKLAVMTELLPTDGFNFCQPNWRTTPSGCAQSAMFHSTRMGCLALLHQASRRFAYYGNYNSTPLREKTARMAGLLTHASQWHNATVGVQFALHMYSWAKKQGKLWRFSPRDVTFATQVLCFWDGAFEHLTINGAFGW